MKRTILIIFIIHLNQNFVTYLDEIDFNDSSYNDFSSDNSVNFVDFSVNVSQPMPLNQQPDLSNHVNSRIKCNRRFDKRHRKRSSRRIAVSLMSVTLLIVPLTFPAGTLLLKMKLLYSVRAPLFSLYPDINWHKCRLDWQLFVDKIRWADFHFDRKSGDVSNTGFVS